MVADLERKRKEKREKEKDNKTKSEPSLFGAIFKGVNKATGAIGDALNLWQNLINATLMKVEKELCSMMKMARDDPIKVEVDTRQQYSSNSRKY